MYSQAQALYLILILIGMMSISHCLNQEISYNMYHNYTKYFLCTEDTINKLYVLMK